MEKLGINPSLILVQLINFGILVFLLKKFLYKPIINAIKEKRQKIEDIEKDREILAKQKEELEKTRKQILEEASFKSQELLEKTKAEAEEERKKILKRAENEARNIIASAQDEIKREKENIQNEIEKKAYEIAKEVIRKILEKNLAKNIQKRIIDTSIASLKQLRLNNEKK